MLLLLIFFLKDLFVIVCEVNQLDLYFHELEFLDFVDWARE